MQAKLSHLARLIDELLPDEKIIADTRQFLNESETAGCICCGIIGEEDDEDAPAGSFIEGDERFFIFPPEGQLTVVYKQFDMWKFDVSSSGQNSIQVVVGLGEIKKFEYALGTIGAEFGFFFFTYDENGHLGRDYWRSHF